MMLVMKALQQEVDGSMESHGETFRKGDAISGQVNQLTHIALLEDTTLVLFLVTLDAKMTLAGNFSGVKKFE